MTVQPPETLRNKPPGCAKSSRHSAGLHLGHPNAHPTPQPLAQGSLPVMRAYLAAFRPRDIATAMPLVLGLLSLGLALYAIN
ncbi:hypothetical protein GCM10011611_44540 [Aliidongia dinghuensis]|uniref:Uncharacterized protein n=1 Tax=Aliidongia dinghuensis TaxID=1867774 RepID=A0A8J3E5L3_9PROT|nr:hypothetical protein GCM10011611_44540 [Aliidongia dinghuensis]